MNSIKYYVLSIRGIFWNSVLIITMLATCYLLLATPTYAVQQASPSANLLDKINALKKEIASKAADLKHEVSKKLQNKAYAGFISQISDFTVILGDKKTILINEYTDFKSKFKSQKMKLTLKDFATDDYVVALGDVDDKNQLKARVLIKTQALATDSSKLVWGQIESVGNGQIIVKTKDHQTQIIQTQNTTSFILGNEEASILDAKKGKFLIAKGKMQGDILYVRFVYYIPGVGFIKPEKKVSSISATPSDSLKKEI